MSQTRTHPSEDTTTRAERAEDIVIEDVRIIEGDEFGLDDATVYEIDCINDSGERRENLTIIPSILFESTKDVQHRHDKGIVGKYTIALARENDTARQEAIDAIRSKRDSVQDDIESLKEKDARLMHTQAELDGL